MNASYHVSRSVMLNKKMIERPHSCWSSCLPLGMASVTCEGIADI